MLKRISWNQYQKNRVRLFKAIIICLPILAIPFLAGFMTSGRDFVRPRLNEFQLGATTKAEIAAQYGLSKYEFQYKYTLNDNTDPFGMGMNCNINCLSYDYFTFTPQRFKSLAFYFIENRLIGYFSWSTFPADSTDFDESLIPQLKIGTTTQKDTLSLFREPSSLHAYPKTKNKTDIKWEYNIFDSKGGGSRVKMLELLFSSDGILRDMRLKITRSKLRGASIGTHRNITTPHLADLELGVDDRNKVESRYGSPDAEEISTETHINETDAFHPNTCENLVFTRSSFTHSSRKENNSFRNVDYYYANNRLVGYNAFGKFDNDSPNISQEVVNTLKINGTTKQELSPYLKGWRNR